MLHSPNADLPVTLGRIAIAPLLSLSAAPDELCKRMEGLSEGSGCRVFVMDSSPQFGTVCIVINTALDGGVCTVLALLLAGLIFL